jgi:ergothioneine biosynthesis protein EgtB
MAMSSSSAQPVSFVETDDRNLLLERFRRTRRQTEALCRPLAIEDYGIQTMDDVSPPKWHIAHVSWFFEAFLLKPFATSYREYHPRYDYLFNSYYITHGQPFARPRRGLLSRPTVEEIYAFRAHVDAAMAELIETVDEQYWPEVAQRVTLGIHHEQQHQELLLTDIKHILAFNPLRPAYREDLPCIGADPAPLEWIEVPGGVAMIGYDGNDFCFDNETPRHRVYIQDHVLASRPVTNGEYLEFIEAGGYRQPRHWLSQGWDRVCRESWQAPLYWEKHDGRWWHYTLSGMRPVDENAPVCHVSFVEADAYAGWAGKRLPGEAEWEIAAARREIDGNLCETGCLQPMAAPRTELPAQLFGDVWEWTQSSYAPYPGFKPLDGTLGEYNGKFMCSQMVLRGGSCVTPRSHIRASYRNFFYPADRWQFTGIRLAGEGR